MQQSDNSSELLVSRPTIAPKIKMAKTVICLFVALMAISIAAIFIVSRFYANRIQDSISTVSLLKEYRLILLSSTFKLWGSQPNHDNNIYQKSYKLFNYTGDSDQLHLDSDKFVLVDNPFTFGYNFEYVNATFAQGNVGEISFVNKWQLHTQNSTSDMRIRNINLALNKIFFQFSNYPIQRKFPILFNTIIESMKQQFLQQFYTEYLFRFFFKDTQLVKDTVFVPLNLSSDMQNKLLEDQDYGWKTSKGLQAWMTICLASRNDTPIYSNIKNKLALTDKEMSNLVGNRSTMYHLTLALNGTIKNKLATGDPSTSYNCQDNVCNNDELIASQWAVSFLTKNELMKGIILDTTAKNLNNTFEKDIEFSEFCTNYGINNTLSIASALPLLSSPDINLKLISTVNYVVNHKDSPDVIDQYLDTPDSGQTILRYITEYFYKEVILDGLTDDQFTWAWMTYQNFNEAFGTFKRFLINQYLSRAFQKVYSNFTCTDYFAGDVLSKYKVVACSNPAFNITKDGQSYFPYIMGYFFDNRQQLNTILEMKQTDVDYLFNSDQSLFANQMKTILSHLSKFYKCESQLCSDKELAYRQWGEASILSQLPPQYFGDTKTATLLKWDTKGIFNGVPSQYAIYSSQPLNYTKTKEVLSSDGAGILGLLSLLRRIRINDQNMIGYLNKVLIGQVYNKIVVQKGAQEYLLGYYDPLIAKQNAKESINGGTPWEQPSVRLIETDNTKELSLMDSSEVNKINTGIFDQDKLRLWKAVNGRYKTGYKIIIDNDEDGLLSTWIDTGRPINGTNSLGFHPYITEEDTLQLYVESIRRTLDLRYKETKNGDYNIYRFTFKDQNTDIYVGDETLDNKYIRVSQDSYVDIEITTGQTVQMKIITKSLSKPGVLTQESQPSLIPIYQEETYFKRNNLARFDALTAYGKSQTSFKIAFIVIASVSLLVILILSFMIWRWSKGLIQLEESLEQDSSVIRTNLNETEKGSQITHQGTFY